MSEAVSGAGSAAAPAERSWTTWGAVAIVAAVIADILFNQNVDKGENGGTGPMLAVGGILIVVGVVLYVAVFPRVQDASRGALVTGILTVLSLAAFWSGAPLLLAVATYVFFRRASDSTPARVAMGLAAVAAVLDVVAALSNVL